MRDNLQSGAGEVPNTAGGSFSVYTLAAEVAYRPGNAITLRALAPVHWKTFAEVASGVSTEKNGLGDLELLASLELLNDRSAAWSAAVSAGVTLPTGATEAQPFVGEVVPTPLQLGSGTFDPLLAVAVRRRFGARWAAASSAGARLAVMENSHDYKPASVVEAGASGAWSPSPGRVEFEAHIEWSHLTHVEVAGVEVPNTGRDAIYLAPGAHVRIGRGWSAGLRARLPLYLRVNSVQFVEDYLLAARLVYRPPSRG